MNSPERRGELGLTRAFMGHSAYLDRAAPLLQPLDRQPSARSSDLILWAKLTRRQTRHEHECQPPWGVMRGDLTATEGAVEYILLTLRSWAPPPDELFEFFSGWHLLVAGGVILVLVAVASR